MQTVELVTHRGQVAGKHCDVTRVLYLCEIIDSV